MTPLDRANALLRQGQAENSVPRLEQAMRAYRAALAQTDRATAPQNWAALQMNLGTALRNIGERVRGTAPLEQAIIAYEAALTVCTRDRSPDEWAQVQMNLGNVFTNLGQRGPGTARFDDAIAAYNAARTVHTRDALPGYFAMIQGNLCNIALAQFDTTKSPDHLDTAQRHLDVAREVFVNIGATPYVAQAERQQTHINDRRATLG